MSRKQPKSHPKQDIRTRPLSDAELLVQVQSAVRALHTGIVAFDAGSDIALQDISARLRQLVCHGDGNRWLHRLAIRCGIVPPLLKVTLEAGSSAATGALPDDMASKNAKYVDFAVGGLQPSSIGPGGASGNQRLQVRSLQNFLESRALIVTFGRHTEKFTWDALLSNVANKLGPVHLDDEIPVALDEIGRYRVLGLNPIAYCVRSAAALICQAAHELLVRAGAPMMHEPHADRTRGMWIGGVTIGRGDDTPGNKPRSVAVEITPYDLNDRLFLSGPGFELSLVDGGRLQFKKLTGAASGTVD